MEDWPWWDVSIRGHPKDYEYPEFYRLKEAWCIEQERKAGKPVCQWCGMLKREHIPKTAGINEKIFFCPTSVWEEETKLDSDD